MSSLCSVVAFGQCHLVSILLWAIATEPETTRDNATSTKLRIPKFSSVIEWEDGGHYSAHTQFWQGQNKVQDIELLNPKRQLEPQRRARKMPLDRRRQPAYSL